MSRLAPPDDYMLEPLTSGPEGEERKDATDPRLNKARLEGDVATILSIHFEAQETARAGVYCSCTQPTVVGLETLCDRCLLINETQLVLRQDAAERPHNFQPIQGFKSMCVLCKRGGSDPLHG